MESNKDEAVRAKGLAEEEMLKNDFEGARKIALQARSIFPELDNLSRLISVCDIHCSAQKKIYGAEMDLYGILQVENTADEATIRKQYRKLALVLHPDKNKFPGAEAAFKLIGEANTILSDEGKRAVYDIRCKELSRASVTKVQRNQSSYASNPSSKKNFNNNPSSKFNDNNHRHQSTTHSGSRPSSWTCCPSCKYKYEYYREVFNQPGLCVCPNCSKLFIPHDVGAQATWSGFVHVQKEKAQPHVTQQEPEKWEKVNVNTQNNGHVPFHFAYQTSSTGVKFGQHGNMEDPEVVSSRTDEESGKEWIKNLRVNIQKPMETGTSNDTNTKRGTKVEAECSGSSFGVEDADARDELNPRKKSRLRKSSNDVEPVTHDDHSDSDSGSEPELVDCLEPEFNNFDNFKLPRSPRGTKNQKPTEEVVSDLPKDFFTPSNGQDSFGGDGDVNTVIKNLTKSPRISSQRGKPQQVIHDFSADKVICKFQVGQILAFWEHGNGIQQRYRYAQIKKIHFDPFRLHVSLLTPCNTPSNTSVLHRTCGLYKVSAGKPKYVSPDAVSHIVEAEASGKHLYNIYPKEQQIWALYKGQNVDNLKHGECEIVQVLETDESSIKFLFLIREPGYKSVFKAPRIPATVVIPRIDLVNRFSHQIPAFLFTEEKDGCLKGCWELDPAALAGLRGSRKRRSGIL